MTSSTDAGNVVTLSRSLLFCVLCGETAQWRVIGEKADNRACTACLGAVADDTPTDSFQPLVLVRIFPKRGAA
jgi:hypothetical protein